MGTVALLALAASCTTTSPTSNHQDTAVGPRADLGTDVTHPIPEMDPYVRVTIGSPMHLQTNVDPLRKIEFIVLAAGLSDSVAETYIQQAVSLKTLTGQISVAGSFDAQVYNQAIYFIPSKPLAMDTEYVIEVVPSKYVKVSRTRSLFHVGSMPRVKGIGFPESSAKPGQVEKIVVVFSEAISQSTAIASAKVTDVASSQLLSASTTPVTGYASYLHIDLATPHPQDKSIEIEIGTNVGAKAGGLLDGLYKSVAGSGPFKLRLTPRDVHDSAQVQLVSRPVGASSSIPPGRSPSPGPGSLGRVSYLLSGARIALTSPPSAVSASTVLLSGKRCHCSRDVQV